MSIISKISEEELTEYQIIADRILTTARTSTDMLIESLKYSLSAIWDNEEPEKVIEALGTNAKECFLLSSATIAYLTPLLSGVRQSDLDEIMAIIERIPPYTMHDDGTVTLNES